MANLEAQIHNAELYCENQGDKFHPLSDEALDVIRDETSNEEKVIALRVLCAAHAETFPYHVGRMTEHLDNEE